ncbi:unnamed protein product [Urochloa humidicola]
MVTLLRPRRHAHGPAAVSRSHHQLPSLPLPPSCRRSSSVLRPMAQDPSHPHRQSTKDTAAPPPPQPPQQDQPEQPPQPEIAPHQPAPPQHDVAVPEASTSSSTGSDAGSSWLQLGIGPSSASSPSPSSSSRRKRQRTGDDAGPSTSVHPAAPQHPPPPQLRLSLQPAGPSSSSAPGSAAAVVAAAPPPPAHEAGTWFLLRAAQNQRREPPLPQIARSYLRVSRDGRMTVRVVMSYLVNKLGLDDDSQLEITCRGQRLPPTMTLQQVRDNIWRPMPAEAAAVLPAPGSPSTNQIMTLHYGRS